MADFASDNSVGFKIIAPSGFSQSATSAGFIAGGGDHNNDGFADILFGVGQLSTNKGIVYVIYGHNATSRSFVDVDLTTFTTGSKGFRILGAANLDQFGTAIANAGDFNDDDFDDIIACAPYADQTGPVKTNTGICYVIFGKPASQRTTDVNLATFSFTATTGFKITGTLSNSYTGFSVDGNFDFNNDGRADVVVGNSYGAYIFFGRGSAFSYASISLTGFVSSTSEGMYVGGTDDSSWGLFVRNAGDLNGDGIDDLLMLNNVVFGHTGAGVSSISKEDIMNSPNPFGFMIYSNAQYCITAPAGDVNGDGLADLVASIDYLTAHGRSSAGYVYVIYGQNTSASGGNATAVTLHDHFLSGPTTGVRVYGAEVFSGLGWAIGPAGDWNHDGRTDLLLQSLIDSEFAGEGSSAMQVYIFSLPEFPAPPLPQPHDLDLDALSISSTFQRVLGATPDPVSATSAGDFNGDGIDDLLVTASILALNVSSNLMEPVSGAYILFGNDTVPVFPLDLGNFNSSNSGGFKIFSPTPEIVLQKFVSGGDCNNDGFSDILFADAAANSFTGVVYVIYGRNASAEDFADLDLSAFTTGTQGFRILGAAAEEYLGSAVSSAGDFNSDGCDDIFVCAFQSSMSGVSKSGACFMIFGQPTSQRTEDVDLATYSFTATTGFKILGHTANGYLGYSVRGGFDFNDDGHDDVMIGQPYGEYLSPGGGAFVLFGNTPTHEYSTLNIEDFPADGVAGTVVYSFGESPRWRDTIETLGDVNGDGIDDLLVIPLDQSLGAVIFGSAMPQGNYTLSHLELPCAWGFLISSNSTDASGAEVMLISAAGDANGDGINDILVSLFTKNALNRAEAGIVFVIFGREHVGPVPLVILEAFTSSPINGVRILGSAKATHLGSMIHAGGDFNHDGAVDLLLVSTLDYDISDSDSKRTGASQLYILSLDQQAAPTSQPTSFWNDVDLEHPRAGHSRGFSVYGEYLSSTGIAMSAAGDFNGDGFDDVILAAPDYRIENIQTGAVYVLFGRAGALPTADLDLQDFESSNSVGFMVIGITYASTGTSVSGGGDFNKDGFADIIIGSPNIGNGTVHVIYGRNTSRGNFVDVDLSTFETGPAGFVILGAAQSDQLGYGVSNIGDFNSDTFDDIVVCAKGSDESGLLGSGACYVIFGRPVHLITADIDLFSHVFTAATGFKVLGGSMGGQLGGTVSGGFDFNNDGHSDFIVGAPGAGFPGRSFMGAAYVIAGSTAAYAYATIQLVESVLPVAGVQTMISGVDLESWGYVVSSAGDVNHDGLGDVLIGSSISNKVYLIFGRPVVSDYLVNLNDWTTGSTGYFVSHTFAIVSFGSARDVSGDGIDDMLFGVIGDTALGRTDAGVVYVLFGKESADPIADVDLSSFSSGYAGVRIIGQDTTHLGLMVCAAGDFNNDTVHEILLNSNLDASFDRTNAGRVYMLSIAPGPPTPSPTPAPTNPTAQPSNAPSFWHDVDLDGDYRTEVTSGHALLGADSDNLGATVSAVGDFNGDGIDDILIGAPQMKIPTTDPARGGAYLLFGTAGSPAGTPDVDLATFASSSTVGVRFIGPFDFSTAGMAIGGGGDVNNDGFKDIIIGAPGSYDGSYGGATFVIYGHNATMRPFEDIYLASFASGPAGFVIVGAASGDSCGSAVSNAGDMNDDGFDDVITCAPSADLTGPSVYNGGACYVIFGKPSSERTQDIDLSTFSFTASSGFKIIGSVMSGNLGTAVSGGFDFNNDGYSDVVVGCYGHAPSGRTYAGAAFVIFGHANDYSFATVSTALFTSSTTVGLMIMGAAESQFWGALVVSAGDVNDDGFDDVLVSSGTLATAVVVFGSEGAGTSNVDLLGFTAGSLGFQLTDNTGATVSIAGAGDVNGDGIDDILIGSPSKEYLSRSVSGIVYLVFGKESTAPVVNVDLSALSSGSTGVVLYGGSNTSIFGSFLSAAGDLNRDGVMDFTVTSTLDASYGRDSAGKVYVLSVAPPVPTFSPTIHPTMSTVAPSVTPTITPTFTVTATPTVAPTVDPAMLTSIQSSPTFTVRNGFAFAVRSGSGKVLAWGEAPHGGALSAAQSVLLQDSVVQVAASRFAYAALKSNGSVFAWGVITGPPGAAVIQANSLVANEAAFAGVTVGTGAVVAFGSNVNGGNVADDARCNGYKIPLSSGVSTIVASAGAFAALKTDQTVYSWGNVHAGGGISTLTLPTLVGVVDIVATRSAFAARLSTGAVVVWGDPFAGGDATAVLSQLQSGIIRVVASRAAFAAFTTTYGLVVWGHPKYGGDASVVMSKLSANVKFVAHTFTAMAALKVDGSVVTWGKSTCGGDSSAVQSHLQNIVSIVGNGRAFAALTAAGGVVAWGKASDGGVIPADKAVLLASGVVSLHHTDRAFAALKSTGQVVVWGQAGHGGSPGATIEALLLSSVHTVCANDASFSAIKFNGDVIGWGHPISIPSPGIILNSGLLTPATCA